MAGLTDGRRAITIYCRLVTAFLGRKWAESSGRSLEG